MADTYDLTTSIGKVRLYIRDSDVAGDHQFSDEEITVYLDEGGSNRAAAGLALMTWAAALGREDKKVTAGSWTGERGDVIKDMLALADSFFELAGFTPANRTIGFLSASIDWTESVEAERIIRERDW